jgi:hypothetical protein
MVTRSVGGVLLSAVAAGPGRGDLSESEIDILGKGFGGASGEREEIGLI